MMNDTLTRADWIRVLKGVEGYEHVARAVISALVVDYMNTGARDWLVNQVRNASEEELKAWMKAQTQVQKATSQRTTPNMQPSTKTPPSSG